MLAPNSARKLMQTVQGAVRDNAVVIAAALGLSLAARGMAWGLDQPFSNNMVGAGLVMIVKIVPLFILVLLIWRLGQGMLVVRPARPAAWLAADLTGFLRDTPRLLTGALGLAAVMAFLSSFSLVKDMIPAVQPFVWDETLANADRALHGGVDPWLLLQPLTGSPTIMAGLGMAYHFWIYINLFLLTVACFSRVDQPSRGTFLVSYVLTWVIVGNLMAIAFASGGPVYWQGLGLGDRFQPLTDQLRAFDQIKPIWALEMQARLWETYSGTAKGISGISAMPSMHVASTTIMVLYAFTWRRWAGWAMTVFAAIIMIGSVALGWHYALDGYVGAGMALLIWHGVRALQRKPDPLGHRHAAALSPAE